MTREIPGIVNFCDTPGVSAQKYKSDKIDSLCELKNSFEYDFELIVILFYRNNYRLLVINKNVLLMDESYKTAKEAKNAFLRKFSHRIFKHLKNRTRPEWLKFSPIDTNIDLKSIFTRVSQV